MPSVKTLGVLGDILVLSVLLYHTQTGLDESNDYALEDNIQSNGDSVSPYPDNT